MQRHCSARSAPPRSGSHGQGTRFDTDPETGWFERAIVRIGSWLLIEWLL